MGQILKLSTAVNITVLMIDSADHITGKTGLAAGLTIYLTKAAGTPATITPTVTELDSTNVKGLYKLALTSGHTDTAGEFQLHITATGADPTDVAHQVVAFDPASATNLGLSALPTANPGANGGLPTTNGTKLNQTVDLTAAAIQAIWDALTSALTTVGSIGKRLADDIDATISSRLATSGYTAPPSAASIATAVWDSLTSALTTVGSIGKWIVDKLDVVVSTRLATSGYTAPPSVGAIADQVWDEAIAGHVGAGSTGAALNAAGGAGDPWATLLPGAYGVGTAGKILGDSLDPSDPPLPTSAFTAAPTANQNADALLDRADAVETGLTPRKALRAIAASAAGELSGADSSTIQIQGAGVATVRITADVDSDGNRDTVVLNL